MRHDDREINSVSELLTALDNVSIQREVLWFRGHSVKEWKLTPSLVRKTENLLKETELIKRFIQLSVPHLTDDVPKDDWEWIF